MHELSIVQSLIDAVLDKTGSRAVTGVNLRIGPLVRACSRMPSVSVLTLPRREPRWPGRGCDR